MNKRLFLWSILVLPQTSQHEWKSCHVFNRGLESSGIVSLHSFWTRKKRQRNPFRKQEWTLSPSQNRSLCSRLGWENSGGKTLAVGENSQSDIYNEAPASLSRWWYYYAKVLSSPSLHWICYCWCWQQLLRLVFRWQLLCGALFLVSCLQETMVVGFWEGFKDCAKMHTLLRWAGMVTIFSHGNDDDDDGEVHVVIFVADFAPVILSTEE